MNPLLLGLVLFFMLAVGVLVTQLRRAPDGYEDAEGYQAFPAIDPPIFLITKAESDKGDTTPRHSVA